jgi:hypothetical protein
LLHRPEDSNLDILKQKLSTFKILWKKLSQRFPDPSILHMSGNQNWHSLVHQVEYWIYFQSQALIKQIDLPVSITVDENLKSGKFKKPFS